MDAVVRGDVLLLCRQAPGGELIFRYSFHTTFALNTEVGVGVVAVLRPIRDLCRFYVVRGAGVQASQQ